MEKLPTNIPKDQLENKENLEENSIEELVNKIDLLEKKVQHYESLDQKPEGWDKIKDKIMKTTRRTARTLAGLMAVGATFATVTYKMSRYEVDTTEASDGKKEYVHEDERTTHYLEVLSGRDTLNIEDFKDFLVPYWQIEVDEFLKLDLEKPLADMTMEEMDALFIETNLYYGATATEKIQERYEKYIRNLDRQEENQIPIDSVYSLVWQMEQEVGNPKIRFMSEDFHLPLQIRSSGTLHYWPTNNTIYVQPEALISSYADGIYAELSHAKQFEDRPVSALLHFTKDAFDIFNKSGFDLQKCGHHHLETYSTPGTFEHEAHGVIEPYLRNKYQIYKSNKENDNEK